MRVKELTPRRSFAILVGGQSMFLNDVANRAEADQVSEPQEFTGCSSVTPVVLLSKSGHKGFGGDGASDGIRTRDSQIHNLVL